MVQQIAILFLLFCMYSINMNKVLFVDELCKRNLSVLFGRPKSTKKAFGGVRSPQTPERFLDFFIFLSYFLNSFC